MSALCFPGEESREFWLCEANGAWKRVGHASGGVMGIETISFDSAPFWSLNHEDAPDEAVALRWEGFDISNEEGSLRWTHWPVMRKDKQTLVGTLALTAESDVTGTSGFRAAQFEPAACMLPLPADGMAVWCELGRYVAAFTRGEKLLHAAVLASRCLDADAAFEVRDLFAVLRAHGFIDKLETIRVWAAGGTDFIPQLACLFEDASVAKEARPQPRLPAKTHALLPLKAAASRRRRQRHQHRVLVLAAAALVCLCFFGAWWLRLRSRESQLARAEIEMNSMQPEVDLVREAQARWLEVESAINPDLYPVELFHQVALLLPQEGIRLKEFQIEDGRLILSGEATTVNDALRFKDRLAASEELQRYAWNFPVPAIREDNRADFRAEGTLSGEVVDEGQ